MRIFGLLALFAASPAWGWDHQVSSATPTPAEVRALVSAPMGDRTVAVALGAEASWILDPLHGEVVRTLDRGGVAAVLADTDGDGRDELVGCGETGVWAVPWTGRYGGEATTLSDRPCLALEVVASGPRAGLVAAGDGWVATLAGGESGWTATPIDGVTALAGAPLLASHGASLAYSAVGADQVLELGPAGRSSFATGGPIGDLAWSRRGWTWTLPDAYSIADYTHQETPLPDARLLVPVDEDRLLVVGDGVSTWLVGDAVEAFSTPAGAVGAVHGDVDGDGCLDLVIAAPGGVTTLTAVCAPDATAEVAPETGGTEEDDGPRLRTTPRYQRKRMVMGVEVPSFLGRDMASKAELERNQRYIVVGSGWAMGRTLGPVDVQIPFFPALALGYELGGPRARFFIGVDSAALFFWLRADGRGGGIHLANATMGMSFGSPRLRAGPFITGGILNYGGGFRAALTPWLSGGAYKGIEARMTVFGPSTGEVMILYVWSQPMRNRSRDYYTNARPEPAPEKPAEYPELARLKVRGEPRARAAMPICGRFAVGAGAATSVSSTRYSWSFVGSSSQIAFGGSPAVSLACESGQDDDGKRLVGTVISMETAPFLRYLGPNDAQLHHFGSLTGGIMLGGEGFRAGPIATAGIWALGGGLRTVVGLHTDRQGLRHHLELRAMGLYKGAPAGEALLLYGFSWDPWKAPEFRDDD